MVDGTIYNLHNCTKLTAEKEFHKYFGKVSNILHACEVPVFKVWFLEMSIEFLLSSVAITGFVCKVP